MLKKLYALKNKKGFTLVELMVVVAILGILVAVAVPVYKNSTKKATYQTVQANCRTIESAVSQMAAVAGKDMATAITGDEAITLTTANWNQENTVVTGEKLGDYIKDLPKDASYTVAQTGTVTGVVDGKSITTATDLNTLD